MLCFLQLRRLMCATGNLTWGLHVGNCWRSWPQLDCAQQLMQNNAGKGGCTELGLQPAFENALRHAIELLLPFAFNLI
jgi:hypothetical protein